MTNPNALPTSPFTDDSYLDGGEYCVYCDASEVRLIEQEDGTALCVECDRAASEDAEAREAEGPDDSYDIDADADRAAYYDAADRADAAMECL